MGPSTRLFYNALRAHTKRTEFNTFAWKNQNMWSRYRMASSASVSHYLGTFAVAFRCSMCMQQFGLKDASLVHHQAYINGQWVDAEDGKRFPVTSKYYTLPTLK